MLWQSLNQSFKTVEFGSPPPAFIILCNALLGHRFVQTSKFCRTCSIPSAKKRCPKCKVNKYFLIKIGIYLFLGKSLGFVFSPVLFFQKIPLYFPLASFQSKND